MDRFEDLQTFVQVVESGSLTRAAGQLQVATSAVSRRIRDLEARLGTQLLQRTTRQMRLTAAGETFHARALEILQALEEAEAEAGNQTCALTGPLRVAAPLAFGRSHLSPILVDFARAHPDLSLDVDFSDRMVDLVAEGRDLAIRIGTLADSSLIARRIADVRLVVNASPAFWDAHGRPAKPADLTELPVLGYAGSDRAGTWSYTEPGGSGGTVTVRPSLRASDGGFLRDAAIAGLGVALQPSFIIHDAVREGLLEPVLTSYGWPTVTIHAVYPATRHLSARTRSLIEFVRGRIGRTPDWEDFLESA